MLGSTFASFDYCPRELRRRKYIRPVLLYCPYRCLISIASGCSSSRRSSEAGKSMGRSGRDTTIGTRCGAGRTELDFALLISSATRTRTLTRGTRGCMSRSGHVPERLAGSEADGNVALWRGCTLRVSGNRHSGGPGHQWVKARYIDPNPAGWEIRKRTRGRARRSSRIAF